MEKNNSKKSVSKLYADDHPNISTKGTGFKDKQTALVKLGNEGFMAKAPMEVVVEIKERLVKTQAEIERITAALAALPKA